MKNKIDNIDSIISSTNKKEKKEESNKKNIDKKISRLEVDKKIIELLELSSHKLHIFYRQFIFISLLTIIILVLTYIIYFAIDQKTFINAVIVVVITVLCILFFAFSGVIGGIKLIKDRRKILGKLIKKFSNNYVIANFFDSSKRLRKEVCLIRNGREIYIKNKLHIINYECIWLDDNRQPNIFFYTEIPNSIDFRFNTHIKKFRDVKGKERLFVTDTQGLPIDVAFDSESLKRFKEDTFATNIIKGEKPKPALTIIIIIVAVIVVILLIAIAFKLYGGSVPVPSTVQNIQM